MLKLFSFSNDNKKFATAINRKHNDLRMYAKAIFFETMSNTFPTDTASNFQIALQLPIILACKMTQHQLNGIDRTKERN